MKRHIDTNRVPVLNPYARISDTDQRKGGGLNRQLTADIKTFAAQYGFKVGKRFRVDDGVSAWKGLNATPEHELGKFLIEAREGLILPGDCLLLENYDRMSRQDPWAAIGLVQQLRELGIHVGRLDKMKLLRCDSTDLGDFFEAAVEFSRGHSESNMKSYRNGDRWAKRRKAARENGETLTRRAPAWIQVVGGERLLKEEAAKGIRRAFALLASGYGVATTLRKLEEEGVTAIGKSGRWTRSYLAKLAGDRRLLGECQPRTGDRSPAGKPIANYFPAVLEEDEFLLARAAIRQRARRKGRVTKRAELFSGLLTNARDGEGYYPVSQTSHGKTRRILQNRTSLDGRSSCYSFPLQTFETAVLTCLREIDPVEIVGRQRGDKDVVKLSKELKSLEAKESEWEAQRMTGDVPAVARILRQLAEDKQSVADRLASARERAAHPLSESWGNTHSLIDALASSPNPLDTRVRLRQEIGRIVESILMLVVPKDYDRLCVVQFWFAGKELQRSYIILHRRTRANGSKKADATWEFLSFADAVIKGSFDLRIRTHVQELEQVLQKADLQEAP